MLTVAGAKAASLMATLALPTGPVAAAAGTAVGVDTTTGVGNMPFPVTTAIV